MKKIVIYHNPRCKKSRAGLAYLESKNNDFEIKKYISDGISEEEINEILDKLGRKPEEIVRQQEAYFKKELKGNQYSVGEWLSILSQNPRLIQRPIIIVGDKAVIANPPENLDNIL